jgi:O-antigen ligase
MIERRHGKPSHFTVKAYVAAVIALTLGALLSMNSHDWTWLSRSGSLVVIIGIILTSHHIIEHMRNLNRSQQRDLKFDRDWATEEKQHYIHEDRQDTWVSEKYGLYMLVIGTFVWGFGDLINQL